MNLWQERHKRLVPVMIILSKVENHVGLPERDGSRLRTLVACGEKEWRGAWKVGRGRAWSFVVIVGARHSSRPLYCVRLFHWCVADDLSKMIVVIMLLEQLQILLWILCIISSIIASPVGR